MTIEELRKLIATGEKIDVEILLKLKDEGFSVKEICDKYSLSVAGYYRKIEKYKKENKQ